MKRRFYTLPLILALLLFTGCAQTGDDGELPAESPVQSEAVEDSAAATDESATFPPFGGERGDKPPVSPQQPDSEPPIQDVPADELPAEPDGSADSGADGEASDKAEHTALSPDRVILLLAIVVVILLAVIGWLLYDRRRRNTSSKPAPRRSGDIEVPITREPGKQLVFRVGNLHNIGQRGEQQDSFCLSDIRDERALLEKGLMAVVADGMGGLEGGAAISQLVTDTFLARYRQYAIPDPDAFLYEAARSAETAVETYMAQTGTDGGSTLVAVLLRGPCLYHIAVGDSRIYLLRDGKLLQVNHEHTYGALLMERAARGEVDPEEPYVNPRRAALTAYIGIGNLNQVDRRDHPIPLRPGDKVLLCSDGVFNALGDDLLRDALEGDALTAAQRVEEAVLAQNLSNQDNFTGIILECRAAE